MGSGICRPADESVHQSKKIDVELKKEQYDSLKQIKLLLLGSSDSGKSTIVKQMRIIHMKGFNDTEVINAIYQIRQNIKEAYGIIGNAIVTMELDIPESERTILEMVTYHQHKIDQLQDNDELELLNGFRNLSVVRKYMLNNYTNPAIPDNFAYFYPELERILTSSYKPSKDDIINMRIATQGVHEIAFDFKRYTIRLIDVGGQKTERKKWIHCFEGVTAVLFVTSLSSYDQVVEEEKAQIVPINKVAPLPLDKPKNRLIDSIELFFSIIRNRFLKKSSFILFMNKTDLFKEKLKVTQLNTCLTKYKGDNSFETAGKYIEDVFRKEPPPDLQKLYSHFTQATDTNNIQFVFTAACDIILNNNLTRAGMQ